MSQDNPDGDTPEFAHQGIGAALTIVLGNLDIEFANGRLSLFSHDLMQRIQCDAQQTKVVLDILLQRRTLVEEAAATQEAEEQKPHPPATLQDRMNRLFE